MYHIAMSQSSCNVDALLEGFTAAGGWINKDVFGLQPFESMGYGAIALSYIQVSESPQRARSSTARHTSFPYSQSVDPLTTQLFAQGAS